MKKIIIIGSLLVSALTFSKNIELSDDIHAKHWDYRGKSKAEIAERAEYLTEIFNNTSTPEERAKYAPYKKKYEDAIVINSLMPCTPGIVGNEEKHFRNGLKRNQEAGVTLVSATAYAFPGDGQEDVYTRIDRSMKVAKKLGIRQLKTTKDIYEAKRNNEMVVMFNTQGADFVIEDLNEVVKAEKAGVKAMNFVYNNDNALAGGGTKQASGVTKLGKEFIKKMNESGVIVDVSHSSNQTAIDAAKYSTKPIIASHSNAMGIYNVPRNLSDKAILAVGATGGVVCPTGIGMFLNEEGNAKPEDYVEHIIYISNLIGKDKVGFSTDFLHNYEDYLNMCLQMPDVYPPEKGYGVPMENVATEDIWGIVKLLEEEHGWTEKEIRGFLGENLMRVYRANWNGKDEVRIQPIENSEEHKH